MCYVDVRMGPPISLVSSVMSWTPSVVKRSIAWSRGQLPNFDPKDLLPVSLEVSKGAILIGNAAAPTLLVAEFQRSEGTYGIVAVRSFLYIRELSCLLTCRIVALEV